MKRSDRKRALDWRDFLEVAEEFSKPDEPQRYFFRGQGDSKWDLKPTLARVLGGQSVDTKSFLEVEHRALIKFQNAAHLHLSANMKRQALTHSRPWELTGKERLRWWKEASDWWVLMQHHGAPTRLLDWTRSIYVAAYFAVRDLQKDGKIWCCNKDELDGYMQHKFSRGKYLNQIFADEEGFVEANTKDDVFFLDAIERCERHEIQQGCFAMCKNPMIDLAEPLCEASCLTYWLVRKKRKPEFLRQLRLMNITAYSLFPDIDGLGRSVKEWTGWRIRSLGEKRDS